jgi:hypothetical protein
MELVIPGADHYGLHQTAYAIHKGLSVPFRTQTIVRERLVRNAEAPNSAVFDFINWYWSQVPEAKQDKIFAVYQEMRKALDETAQGEFNDDTMRDLVTQMIDLHHYKDLKDWITQPGIIGWPDEKELPRHYEQASSLKYPREKTFILDDYQNLLTFILQLRTIVPLWAEFGFHHKGTIAKVYGDMVRMRFLDNSHVLDSPGYIKLVEYSRAMIVTKSGASKSAVMHSLSTEEYPDWVLANVIFKKLTIQSFRPVDSTDRSAFVVKHICSHIAEALNQSEREFSTPTEKADLSANDSDENMRSRFETVQARAAMPNGDISFIRWYMSDLKRLAKALEPSIDVKMVNDFSSMFSFNDFIPQQPQITLMQWVLAPIISPRCEDSLKLININQGIAVASAVLWHRGHKQIAALLSSQSSGANISSTLVLSGVGRLPKTIYDRLSELFPHQLRARSTERSYKAVSDSIQTLTQEFESFTWKPNLQEHYLYTTGVQDLIVKSDIIKVLQVPQTLYAQLHDMVIDLAARPLMTDPIKIADAISDKLGIPADYGLNDN